MVTIYNINKVEKKNGTIKFLVELRGLADDSKPTTIQNGIIENGSSFIEIDTGKLYMYDLENTEWHEV